MSEPYLAEIRMIASNYAPRGYAFCDGTTLAITQNQALYSLIGFTFGGDGSSNFRLPDLRGRTPVCIGSTNYWGAFYGTEGVTLTESSIPNHTHTVSQQYQGTYYASTDQADLQTPTANSRLGKGYLVYSGTRPLENYISEGATKDVKLSGITVHENIAVNNTGMGYAHSNMQPFLAINYIIAVTGTYPQRPS